MDLPSKTSAEQRKFFEQVQSRVVLLHGDIVSGRGASKNMPGLEVREIVDILSLSVGVGCELISLWPELSGKVTFKICLSNLFCHKKNVSIRPYLFIVV